MAIELSGFMGAVELFLVKHPNDSIFTVVQNRGRFGTVVASPSYFLGLRWIGVNSVNEAFKNPNVYLSGAEVYQAIMENNQFPTVVLYRHDEELTLFGEFLTE